MANVCDLDTYFERYLKFSYIMADVDHFDANLGAPLFIFHNSGGGKFRVTLFIFS